MLQDDIQIPEQFLCPITKCVMVEPVVASDGNTYERDAIEKWIKAKGNSPLVCAQRHSRVLFLTIGCFSLTRARVLVCPRDLHVYLLCSHAIDRHGSGFRVRCIRTCSSNSPFGSGR